MNYKLKIFNYFIIFILSSQCVSKQKLTLSADYYSVEFGKRGRLTLSKTNKYYFELDQITTHYIDSGYFARTEEEIIFHSYIDKPNPILDTTFGITMWCYDKNNLEKDTAEVSVKNITDRILEGVYLTINDSIRIPVPTLNPNKKYKTQIIFKGDCQSNFIIIHLASAKRKNELYKHMDLSVGIDTSYFYRSMLEKGTLQGKQLILPLIRKDTLILFGQ